MLPAVEIVCGAALAFAFVVGTVVRNTPPPPLRRLDCADCGGRIAHHFEAIDCAGCGRRVHLGCLPHRH